MNTIKRHLKQIIVDFIWIIYNVFINKIPVAFLRKIFYRMVGLKIGRGSRIGYGTVIVQPWKIRIGRNTVINEYCYLDGRGGLDIGDNVSVSIYSKILTASHNVDDDKFTRYKKKVIINDQVWIGMAAIILEGSELTRGSVVGANGVFKGVSEEMGIYVGNPSELRRKRVLDSLEIRDLSYFK